MTPNHPDRLPHAPQLSRRARSAVAAASAIVVVGTLVTACSSTAARPTAARQATPSGAPSPYGAAPSSASPATVQTAQAVSRAFSAQVDAATAAFGSSVARLQADAASGDTAAARADELAAQGDFDAFRVLESGNAINGATLDERSTDVGPRESFGGLHAVERDLWTSGPLASDVSGLAGQAPVAQFLLGRERLGPEAIGVVAVDQLNWVADDALPISQEQYSHLGLVDVAATEHAAHQTFTDLLPLAQLVDPALASTIAGQFAVLDSGVVALGDPTTVPDTAVDPTARLALSRQLDATAATLARLAAALTPFGTRGAPS